MQLVVGMRVGVETLDKAVRVLSSQASSLSSEVMTNLKHLLGSVIRIQAFGGLREDDDLVGTFLLEVVRESRELLTRDNASLTSKFANL